MKKNIIVEIGLNYIYIWFKLRQNRNGITRLLGKILCEYMRIRRRGVSVQTMCEGDPLTRDYVIQYRRDIDRVDGHVRFRFSPLSTEKYTLVYLFYGISSPYARELICTMHACMFLMPIKSIFLTFNMPVFYLELAKLFIYEVKSNLVILIGFCSAYYHLVEQNVNPSRNWTNSKMRPNVKFAAMGPIIKRS